MEKTEQCIQSEYVRNADMNELYEIARISVKKRNKVVCLYIQPMDMG
ncbi:MAG: hypothetical protein PHU34_10205 [Candidatus Methanoperedens sp.]|nr:hypothetical protein [Candidatus Methanoperedens sp.]